MNKQNKTRAKTRFSRSVISELKTEISNISPQENKLIKAKELLIEVKEELIDAYKKGCDAEDIYKVFINKNVHISKAAFIEFWRQNINKKTGNKKTNKTIKAIKNKSDVIDKTFLKETKKVEINKSSDPLNKKSGFVINADSDDI